MQGFKGMVCCSVGGLWTRQGGTGRICAFGRRHSPRLNAGSGDSLQAYPFEVANFEHRGLMNAAYRIAMKLDGPVFL